MQLTSDILGGFLEVLCTKNSIDACKPRLCLLLMGSPDLTHAYEGTGKANTDSSWQSHRLRLPELSQTDVPVLPSLSSGSCLLHTGRDPPWFLGAAGFGLVDTDPEILRTSSILWCAAGKNAVNCTSKRLARCC